MSTPSCYIRYESHTGIKHSHAGVYRDFKNEKVGFVRVSPEDKILSQREVRIHETVHVVVHEVMEKIKDNKVRWCLEEGIADLVALAVVEPDSAEQSKIAKERALAYGSFKGRGGEVKTFFSDDSKRSLEDDKESPYHLVGRRFVFSLVSSTEQPIPLSKMFHCFLKNPPSMDDLLNPEKYQHVLDDYNENIPPVVPGGITFGYKAPRII